MLTKDSYLIRSFLPEWYFKISGHMYLEFGALKIILMPCVEICNLEKKNVGWENETE